MSTPRSILGLATRSFAFLFGGIWLLCGAPLLIIGIYVGVDTMRQQARFEREARIADGMVLTKHISRSRNESTTYWVTYRFRAPDGTVITSETKVSEALWDRLVERERVRVTYLPGEPRTNRLEAQGPDWVLPIVMTGLGMLLVPVGGWIFARGARDGLRARRLQHEGRRTAATVTDVEPANVSFNGVGQWRIRYRFQDHRGRERHGESALLAQEEAEQWKAGDTGVARFDVHDPGKSIWVGRR